jgi:hypothetical protein
MMARYSRGLRLYWIRDGGTSKRPSCHCHKWSGWSWNSTRPSCVLRIPFIALFNRWIHKSYFFNPLFPGRYFSILSSAFYVFFGTVLTFFWSFTNLEITLGMLTPLFKLIVSLMICKVLVVNIWVTFGALKWDILGNSNGEVIKNESLAFFGRKRSSEFWMLLITLKFNYYFLPRSSPSVWAGTGVMKGFR